MELSFVKNPKYRFQLAIVFLLAVFSAPSSAHALSCAFPAHRVIAYCENETCFEGFRVYYLPTAFPCETRAMSEDITDFHRQLFYHFAAISQSSLSSGVREISFFACEKEQVEQIPWQELEQQTASGKTDWSEFAINESEWQIRRTSEKTTLIGRSNGCTISFLLTPLGESREVLEELRDEYVGSPFLAAVSYHFRLWIWPLIFVPLFAGILFFIIGVILSWSKEKPLRVIWVALPLLLQLCLFITVFAPATDYWMGPYRLIFFVPCAALFILWLITLLRIWLLLAPHLDALSPKPKQDEDAEDAEN